MEVLVVSNSRGLGWIPPNPPEFGWRVHVVGRQGGRLANRTSLDMQSLQVQTRVIIMLALHCDFTHLTDYSVSRPRDLCVYSRTHHWQIYLILLLHEIMCGAGTMS